jgi:hypothetical protein
MSKNIFSFLLALFIILNFCGTVYSQYPPPSTDFRIFPSSVTQTEPIVCINPLNYTILFASAYTINTSSGFISEGVYTSTNGGYNWSGSDVCNGPNISNHGGDPGVSIDKNGVFIITHIGNNSLPSFYGIYAHYSTDMGANWSSAYTITNQLPEDKGTSTTDNNPSSPYYGRTYAVWANLQITPPPIQFSYTSNSGINWTTAQTINPSPPQRCSGGFIGASSDGTIYACWAGASNSYPYPSNYAGFAYSTNGGTNWNVTQNVYSINGIEPTLLSKSNIRVNSIPRFDIDKSGGSRNGWIYMVSAEKGSGADSSDIILHSSSNNGVNWSDGIRVNQDLHNNGKTQYCPAVCVDSTGAINVLYYDDRNTSSDSSEVMLSRSKNGGTSWTEFIVSSHRFKPKPIAGTVSNYQGDFITIISSGNNLFTYWMDDYSGLYQCWSSVINLSSIGIKKIESEIPNSFLLSQNYPNPFNPVTKINFTIPQEGFASLKIYDIRGIEIAAPVNEKLNSGKYEVTFDASSLASGTYFYKLDYTTKNGKKYSNAKKLVVLK